MKGRILHMLYMVHLGKELPRWKIWESIFVIIEVLGIMFILGFFINKVMGIWQISELTIAFGASLVQATLLIGLSFNVAVGKYKQNYYDLGFIPGGFSRGLVKGIKWGLLLFFLVIILGMLVSVFIPVDPEPQDFAKIILLTKSSWEFILPIIMGVILAPLSEEIYFRGFLYPVLRSRLGVPVGILFSSLLFAGMHFDLYRFIPIAMGGVGLTYLYEKTGNIWTNVVAHAVWNAIMIAIIFIAM
jgi:membrane protease YdiL (CAAX protease family)